MPPVGFEPTISGKRPQTYALDHAATGTGRKVVLFCKTGSDHAMSDVATYDSKLASSLCVSKRDLVLEPQK